MDIVPVLSIESEDRTSGPAVILTWNIMRADEYIVLNGNDKLINTIKEYEIYGYRSEPDLKKQQPDNFSWTLVNII